MTSQNPNESRTGLGNIADLVSGRIHNTLYQMSETLSELVFDIQIMKEIYNTMTKNEQLILNAAQTLGETQEEFRAIVNSMQSKIEALTSQAQSPTATQEPEDLSDEMSTFLGKLDEMKAYAGSLKESVMSNPGSDTSTNLVDNPASPVEVNPNPGSWSSGIDPLTGLPLEQPQPEIPLAGASGVTNPPAGVDLKEGQVYAGQPQPGLGEENFSATTEGQTDETGQVDTDLSIEEMEVPSTDETGISSEEEQTAGVMEGEWNAPTSNEETKTELS